MSFYALILAGGSGTRFWPRSRMDRPKQLLSLAGNSSLLQEAVRRAADTVDAANIFVVTSAMQRTAVLEQLPELRPEQILAEPVGRDTAAAIGFGCALIARRDPDAVVVVTPSDHVIRPSAKFQQILRAAFAQVKKSGSVVVFGVPPASASTAYGYIERGRCLESRPGSSSFEVKSFREKPNREIAEQYVQSGGFYWNCGIFVWRAERLLAGLKRHLRETFQGIQSIASAFGTGSFESVLRSVYPGFQKISIDYAFLEKLTEGLVVLEADFQWNDIGSWNSLEKIYHRDRDGNTFLGKVLGIDVSNTTVWTEGHRMVGLVGVRDLVVIQTHDATLICPKSEVERVRELVAQLSENGLEEYA